MLGACVTHADIEDGRVAATDSAARWRRSPAGIAYRAVRNRGTIGGSLCHADPAADWVTTLPALGACAVIRGLRGERRLPVEAFVTRRADQWRCRQGEILVAVRVPRLERSFVRLRQGLPQGRRFRSRERRDPGRSRPHDGARRARSAGRRADRVGCSELAAAARSAGEPIRLDPEAAVAALIAAAVVDPVRRHIHAAIIARAVRELA